MPAICKTIAIHGDKLTPLLRYGDNPEKTDLLKNGLGNVLSYAANPDKTTLTLPENGEKSLLVDGLLCSPETAESDFRVYRDKYRAVHGSEEFKSFKYNDKKSGKEKTVKRQPITAIHLIQSFSDPDLDPLLVHQIGINMLERLHVQGVCDTHLNADHLHNHIIINAYLPDGQSKFRLNTKRIIEIRTLSNTLLQEYGLPVGFDEPWEQLQKSRSRTAREPLSHQAARATVPDSRNHQAKWGTSIENRNLQSAPDTAPDSRNHQAKWGTAENIPAPQLSPATAPETRNPAPLMDTSLYAWDGRRRGALEMLLRRAINIVQQVIRFMRENPEAESQRYHAEEKLSQLQSALDQLKMEGFTSMDDLKTALNDAGIKTNVARHNGNAEDYRKYAARYKELLHLKQTLTYAASDQYLYGPLYTAPRQDPSQAPIPEPSSGHRE